MPANDNIEDADPLRLEWSDYILLSADPLVGVMLLSTQDGFIDIAINATVARELRANLDRFLAGLEPLPLPEPPEPPRERNPRLTGRNRRVRR